MSKRLKINNDIQLVVGKTIEEISNKYGELNIKFTDGTQLDVSATHGKWDELDVECDYLEWV